MRQWRFMPGEPVQRYALLGEGLELYSPLGLRLIDDFTGGAVLGKVHASLEFWTTAEVGATDIKALPNASEILTYPGLGRQADVAGLPPRRYRVKLKADYYRPLYQMLSVTPPPAVTPFYQETSEGIEFDVYPYNDELPPTNYSVVPPVEIRPQIQDVNLAPAANYPYPPLMFACCVAKSSRRAAAGD